MAIGPQGAPRRAGQVVRRVLLRPHVLGVASGVAICSRAQQGGGKFS
jgi:hypothetical protein